MSVGLLVALVAVVVAIAACAAPVPSPPLRSEAPIPTAVHSPSARATAPPTDAALPFPVTCGRVAKPACDALATRIASEVAREYPGKQIVAMALSGPDSGYTVRFSDGTSVVTIID